MFSGAPAIQPALCVQWFLGDRSFFCSASSQPGARRGGRRGVTTQQNHWARTHIVAAWWQNLAAYGSRQASMCDRVLRQRGLDGTCIPRFFFTYRLPWQRRENGRGSFQRGWQVRHGIFGRRLARLRARVTPASSTPDGLGGGQAKRARRATAYGARRGRYQLAVRLAGSLPTRARRGLRRPSNRSENGVVMRFVDGVAMRLLIDFSEFYRRGYRVLTTSRFDHIISKPL